MSNMATTLHPINGCALVMLDDKSEVIATIEQKYDTHTSGVVLEVNSAKGDWKYLVGCRAYWDAYKDDSKVALDGLNYAFIKLEDLRGYAANQTNP